MRNRTKQRELASKQKKEERLNLKTEWSISDPTPRAAIDNIIQASK